MRPNIKYYDIPFSESEELMGTGERATLDEKMPSSTENNASAFFADGASRDSGSPFYDTLWTVSAMTMAVTLILIYAVT